MENGDSKLTLPPATGVSINGCLSSRNNETCDSAMYDRVRYDYKLVNKGDPLLHDIENP